MLLLDEPLADLDDVSATHLLSFLEEYAADGNAVLVSTHRIEEFAPVLDRLTIVRAGKIVFDNPRHVIDRHEQSIPEFYAEHFSN